MNRKPTKCRICKTPYIKWSMSQKVCGNIECSIAYIESEKTKQKKRIYKENKEKLYTLSDYRRMAQQAVNAWVRWRDRDLGCCSCDKPATWAGQWHAGHYLSRGANPALALNETNISKQCSVCNNWLSGNQRAYRAKLIERIGIDKVEWLEGPHQPAKLSRDDLIKIRDDYRMRLRQAKKYP